MKLCHSLPALLLVLLLACLPPIGRTTCRSPLFVWYVVPSCIEAAPVSVTTCVVSWVGQDENENMELKHLWYLKTQSQTWTMKLATVAFYGFALGLLAVGLRELLTGFEENRCSMTYMFEYPEYRVSSQANYFTQSQHISRKLASSIPRWLRCFRGRS